MSASRVRVSVITAVFNGAAHLEECIRAVGSQTYPYVDHIIVDGGSTDGTIDIIRHYEGQLAKWVSEPDDGIYDAMNKGIAMVSDPESYVLFANADDHLYSDDAIERMIRRSDGEDLLYGRMMFTDGEISGELGREVSFSDLAEETLCHPATFVKRRVFDTIGMFDKSYRIAADYDFIVRAFKAGVSTRFVNVIVSVMRMGGVSDDRFMLSCSERKRVVRRHFPVMRRLAGVAHVNFIDIPRNLVRRGLARMGLLSAWRAVRN